MLQSILIRDFKSYRLARLQLAPLTVLIGANASGKSNALEALRLLSWIAQGNRLSAIRYAVYEKQETVRGTTANLVRTEDRQFRLGARFLSSQIDDYFLDLEVAADDDLHIIGEGLGLKGSGVPLYEVVGRSEGAGNDLRVAYNNFARGGTKPQVICNDQMAVLLQLQSGAKFNSSNASVGHRIPRLCREASNYLSDIIFLDPQPSLMRAYSFKTESKLQGDGSNLSGALYNICEEDGGKESIINFIRSLPEQNIGDIDFIETPRNEVMLKLQETFGGSERWFDATLLSDGTLRVLSIAATILSAPENSLVVIEEIDNGVHPSRAEELLKNISDIAKDRNLRVLISSHNPALLDALPQDAVSNVVFCYRDADDGTSRLVRLLDIPDYPELVSQGDIGHLMTRGILDRFVKHHPGTDVKRQRAFNWLQNLRRTTENL